MHATRDGWRHISGLGKKRSIQDTHRRLDLFKYARSIVERSGTFQYVRSINREIYYSFESVEKFLGIFEKGRKLKRIKVVIKIKKTGKAVFHSVMD